MRLARRIVDSFPFLGTSFRDVRDQHILRNLTLQTVPGHDLKMWGGSWLAAGLYESTGRFHESQEIELFLPILEQQEYLLDIGANNGLFSLLAASKGLTSLAVEPMPGNVSLLARNLKENDLQDHVEIYQVAVAGEVGIADIYGRGQMASLLPGWNDNPRFDKRVVPVNTLDNLFYARLKGRKFAMKMDIEGAELRALEGASQILAERPHVLIENRFTPTADGSETSFERVFRLFWDLGYNCVVADRSRKTVEPDMLSAWLRKGEADAATVNFLMAPPGRR